MKQKNIMFALMNLIAAAEGRSPLGVLDLIQRRLLVFIASQIEAGRDICITDILTHGEFGVPVTASKRLRDLEAQGWVTITRDPANHRRRLIALTPKALSGFGAVSQHLTEALPEVIAAPVPRRPV